MSAAVERGLLDAIWESPHDDTPRLIYADWLEETGEESNQARAELIRIQCELAHMPGDDPRFDTFEDREEELVNKWTRTWIAGMPKGCRKGKFDRGFPMGELGEVYQSRLIKVDAERLQAVPLWRCNLSPYDLDSLLSWPQLHRIDMFPLHFALHDGRARQFTACANLRNMSELFFEFPIQVSDLQLILDAWSGRSLRALTVVVPKEREGFIATLTTHPAVHALRRLSLRRCELKREDLSLFAQGRQLAKLIEFDCGLNNFGEGEIVELLKWPFLNRLRRLNLSNCGLTDTAAVRLARCPAVSSLRSLFLGANQIGAEGATALSESPYLKRLNLLSLHGNPVRK